MQDTDHLKLYVKAISVSHAIASYFFTASLHWVFSQAKHLVLFPGQLSQFINSQEQTNTLNFGFFYRNIENGGIDTVVMWQD